MFAPATTATMNQNMNMGSNSATSPSNHLSSDTFVEVRAVVTFLASYLVNNLPRRKILLFSQQLAEYLQGKFKHQWNPKEPQKGSAFRCIRLCQDGLSDALIATAAQAVGLEVEEVLSHLPADLIIWVDPAEVSFRIGDRSRTQILYSANPNTSPSTPNNAGTAPWSLNSSPVSSNATSPDTECPAYFADFLANGGTPTALPVNPTPNNFPFLLDPFNERSHLNSHLGPTAAAQANPFPNSIDSKFTVGQFAMTRFGTTKLKSSAYQGPRRPSVGPTGPLTSSNAMFLGLTSPAGIQNGLGHQVQQHAGLVHQQPHGLMPQTNGFPQPTGFPLQQNSFAPQQNAYNPAPHQMPSAPQSNGVSPNLQGHNAALAPYQSNGFPQVQNGFPQQQQQIQNGFPSHQKLAELGWTTKQPQPLPGVGSASTGGFGSIGSNLGPLVGVPKQQIPVVGNGDATTAKPMIPFGASASGSSVNSSISSRNSSPDFLMIQEDMQAWL